jgi:integrase
VLQSNFRQVVFQPAARRAEVVPVPTVHDLRHTAASLFAKAGLTLQEAADQLGHGSTTMTARYSHIFPEHRQAKIAKLEVVA